MGHKHTNDELLCTDTGDLLCKVPMCSAGFHNRGESCPEAVMTFPSEGIKHVVLPLCVPNEKIAELWLEYGYNNEEQNKMYSTKFNFDQNSEINRLETQIQALKKKLLESSPEYLKKQEKLEKINALMLKRREEYEAKRNEMINKKMKKIKGEEDLAKQRVLKKSLKRREALQSKKEKKNGE